MQQSFALGEQKASCTGTKRGCTGAKEVFGGAKDSWETFAPSSKRSFAPSPSHFWRFSLVGQFPRSAASQVLEGLQNEVPFQLQLPLSLQGAQVWEMMPAELLNLMMQRNNAFI